MKRLLEILCVRAFLGGLLLALLLTTLSTTDSSASGLRGNGAAVALGDSFVSGEAGRWLGNARGGGASANGTDRLCIPRWWGCELRPGGVYRQGPTAACHRSDTAAVEVMAGTFTRRVNLACSGARARDIYLPAKSGPAVDLPSQADRLESVASHERVSLVLVSIGANDVGFSGLVSDCAEAWFSSRPDGCRRNGSVVLADRMTVFRRQVRAALDSVASAMAQAGYSRESWDFVVHGYASPLPPGDRYRYPQSSVRRLLPGGCPFTDSDSDWANGFLVTALNRELSRLAADHGARYLDLSRAFDGHRVCEEESELVESGGPSGSRAEWFRYLVPCCGAAQRESLHPNAYGQRAIGACLALLLREQSGDWACRSRPGFGPASMSLVETSR